MQLKPRYFPQHFRATRPYFTRKFVNELIEAGRRGGHKAASDILFPAVISTATTSGITADRLLERNFLSTEVALAQTMAQLAMDGTPLYELAPELVEALAHSEPGDMCLDETRTPNRSYFLHWGPQPDLLLHGKHPVEGAVVLSTSPDWRIALVARTPYSWVQPPERDAFDLRFPAETLNLPFSQAVDLAIIRDKETLMAVQHPVVAAPGQRLPQAAGAIERALEELELNAPVLKKALSLVGNSIAYLTAYPEDSRKDWEPDTPKSMLLKLGRGAKERVRTESKLQAMGYVQVHQVGLEFQKSVERTHAHAPASGGTVRPHWRRGHWRHQAYGENLAMRKLIWLRMAYGENLAMRKLIWLRPTRVLGAAAA